MNAVDDGRILVAPEPPPTDGVIALRPFRHADVDQVTAACQDPEIQRFIPVPIPYTRDDGLAYVERTIAQWRDGSKAAFAIVGAEDHDLVLGAVNVALVGSAGNSGYWIAPGARGNGIAGRALRLLTDWAFANLELGVIILEIRPENLGSIATAHAAGYHEAGRLDVNVATGKKGGLIFSRFPTDPPPI